ncbi:MAG TPA: PQQ-dependent sugar dehydrogenase [Longimicrobiaceae bacterium]|nr:PQQ-dependent sugar dehydrogenase [Longimicrobiaceae bacterium]
MLYVSVGSTCNNCGETNRENATLLRMRTDGSDRGVYASGLRNMIGWDWHPATGQLWGMDHGSDWRGDDLPPEELNRVENGTHYGWPFCYGDRRVDAFTPAAPPGGDRQGFCRRTAAPVLTYTAHAAPIGMVFYKGMQFPAEYRGDAFVAMRGSWNRRPPSGYKLVRIRFDAAGSPTRIEDFVTGFLSRDGQAFRGRIAGVAVARDGSVLFADDTNGVIYRVAYAGGGRAGSR